MFSAGETLWTTDKLQIAYAAFVNHPLLGSERFIEKLVKQVSTSAASTQRLMSELIWALLLFPSNLKADTKRTQIVRIWSMSGVDFGPETPLSDETLAGIGSGGPGYLAYRPEELEYLLTLVLDLKTLPQEQRQAIFTDYDLFIAWINNVPRKGDRQFRHMLRYFAFPARVERISSNNDRHRILEAFDNEGSAEIYTYSDAMLDDALFSLRERLQEQHPGEYLDFYQPPLRARWLPDRQVNTGHGSVQVTVPGVGEADTSDVLEPAAVLPQATDSLRLSLHMQAKLAQIGCAFGYKVWIPANDRQAVRSLLTEAEQQSVLDGQLPVSYDVNTLDTVKQIDVIWMQGRAIVRAFEVEHTTSIYSGLLRMADLLALQPNISIRLHIVADEERKEEVKRQIQRPVFSLLAAGPLAGSCTFLSYDAVEGLAANKQLRFLRHEYVDSITERAG